MNKYLLVLEFADSGTLNAYLSEHFNELDWSDKYQLALQLASALECIHNCADFGRSRKITEASETKIHGVLPYVDPKGLNNHNKKYKLTKKSDIYSVGVLMWQISSGCRPFKGVDYDISLTLDIINGKREKIIDDTPFEYKCWKCEPRERPNIQEIVSTLKSMTSLKQDGTDDVIRMTADDGLLLENIPNIDHFKNIGSESDSSLKQSNLIVCKNNSSNVNFKELNLSIDSFERMVNNIHNQVVDNLIKIIIKKHNQGNTFNQIEYHIKQQILQFNQNINDALNWLIKNQNSSQYIWFLGLFYYYNIEVDEDSSKAFELFLKAANEGCSIAQVYLARCYHDGYGIESNKELAFKWYQKSVENKSIIGQFYLGHCYEFGIGIKENAKEKVIWYQKAACNGNMIAKLYLADCYRLGKGIEKDEKRAFVYYENLAKQEVSDAQHQLGNCFYNGIGTIVDLVLASCWYEKAANNGNIMAKYILEQDFKKKLDLKRTSNKLYKVIYFEGLRQIGMNNYNGIGTNQNYIKAFSYFQKAANSGNKFAQYNLGNCFKDGKGIKKNQRKAFELFEKSAEQGYINAIFELGSCYKIGNGTDKNIVNVFELYKMAANKGYNIAQNCVDIDEIKTFEYYKKSAEKEYVDAQFQLAYCYNKGFGTRINKLKAFELYRISAGKGYRMGVQKDETKAFELFKRSAEQECLNAQFELGFCYDEGIGTEINKLKAFELYKMAADKENNTAQCNLGYFYENSEDVHYYLGNFYMLGMGVEKDEAIAFEYYKKSAEKGYSIAQYKLGYLYECGIYTEIDLEKATYWYNKAIENENDVIKYYLGI
ncbi:8382_t:CDS:2 [Funneliformis geosporum]|nr:8382_t:CDS:2 [Funneliformis geosporum]